MLQNRIDPFGNIIKTSARGAWMGNRGILHDEHQQVLRPFKLKAWLICLLHFKDRHREVMAPNRYTELFFFDEATAFAAGHRPCFECRRKDFEHFKSAWIKGNPEYGFSERTSINEIDKILHKERIDSKGQKVTHQDDIKDIPDGAFISIDDKPYLLANRMLHAWSPSGYDKGMPIPAIREVTVLTPASTVNAFKAGYMPQITLHSRSL